MWKRRPAIALLWALALAGAGAHADDTRKPPPDPDPGFLEFLGSVDRLAEVNPDYLSQRGQSPAPPPPVKPPPPAPSSPPPPNPAGAPKNE